MRGGLRRPRYRRRLWRMRSWGVERIKVPPCRANVWRDHHCDAGAHSRAGTATVAECIATAESKTGALRGTVQLGCTAQLGYAIDEER
jgi:hypothetical protein